MKFHKKFDVQYSLVPDKGTTVTIVRSDNKKEKTFPSMILFDTQESWSVLDYFFSNVTEDQFNAYFK